MEVEFMSSPFRMESDLTVEVVDDEPSDPIDSGVVPGNEGEGSMDEPLAVSWIVIEDAIDHIQRCLLVGYIADVDWVDLGQGGDRQGHRYPRGISTWASHLQLEGRSLLFWKWDGTDLKPMQEETKGDGVCRRE